MIRNTLVMVAVLASGGVAFADDPAPGPPPIEPAPPAEPAPPPPSPPVVHEWRAAPTQTTSTEPDSERPDGLAIGLGIGYAMQVMSLETPNIASLRLRLPSGLTFEPTVQLSTTSHKEDDSIDSTTDRLTELAVTSLVRLPLIRHGRYDLEGLGAVKLVNTKSNPSGDFNSTTSTAVQLGYGIAVSWWPAKHWNFSMSIVNPLFDYRTTKQQLGAAGMSQKTSDTTIGVILDTDVFFMLHLYN